MRHTDLLMKHLAPRRLLFISLLSLTGCTHAGKPYLTAEEKVRARLQLSKWSNGRVVSYPASDGVKLRGRYYDPRGPTKAVIVALHGIETNSKWYASLTEELAP